MILGLIIVGITLYIYFAFLFVYFFIKENLDMLQYFPTFLIPIFVILCFLFWWVLVIFNISKSQEEK